MSNLHNFDATELCSKKLWEMVSDEHNRSSQSELRAALAELTDRRHYLSELEHMGIFDERRN